MKLRFTSVALMTLACLLNAGVEIESFIVDVQNQFLKRPIFLHIRSEEPWELTSYKKETLLQSLPESQRSQVRGIAIYSQSVIKRVQ